MTSLYLNIYPKEKLSDIQEFGLTNIYSKSGYLVVKRLQEMCVRCPTGVEMLTKLKCCGLVVRINLKSCWCL
jgi:hypothetical protein